MVTIDDKLELFRDVVIDRVQKEIDKKASIIDKENKKIVENYQSTIDEKTEEFTKNFLEEAYLEKKNTISNAKRKVKSNVLKVKKNMIDKVFSDVVDLVKQFVFSDDYKKYLRKIIDEAIVELNNENIILVEIGKNFTIEKDVILECLIEKGYLEENVKFKILDNNLIGGAIFLNDSMMYRIDYCLDSLIEHNRVYIGQLVFEMLNEAGEENE
ncbi:V-type ATP synthase subunit E [Helicovermis profundi]|uniref:V-type ATP synthase subunit E n=1 Tax=Helicovermis profundi TaxID=3065157 RepID=UPI0030D5C6AC